MRTNIPDSYLSPVTDGRSGKSVVSKGTRMSMESMDERLRRINEEFKARSCVGSGFVFNRNVRLESPASHLNKGDAISKCVGKSSTGDVGILGINKLEAGVFKKEVMSNRLPVFGKEGSRKIGMNLYKKPAVGMERMVSQCKNIPAASVELRPGPGYVRSVVNSSIFNRGPTTSALSMNEVAGDMSLGSFRVGGSRNMSSVSSSIISNPLSNSGCLRPTGSSQSVVSLRAPSERSGVEQRNDRSSPRSVYTPKNSSRSHSPTLAPINVMYIKPTPSRAPEESFEVAGDVVGCSSADALACTPPLYAPGPKLTVHPFIGISSTVLDYEDACESTTYYIKVESDVSWTVCKSIKELTSFVPGVQCTTLSNAMSPQDRKIRDSVIQATLNSKLDKRLQSFILSDISEASVSRSSYLLMNNDGWKAYLFKFVGKALICYEKSRVFKIFLLGGCEVSPVGTDGFNLRKSEEGIELYATCEKERDAWITDIREYVGRL